ncbi:MAG: TrkH family potassium uptake protein [Prevotellaceae bacterium]|jgi:trk system potassium uptake protein TrkH|nr:TrkH family potassium uptake protein [Prevotellaceae bacterium]
METAYEKGFNFKLVAKILGSLALLESVFLLVSLCAAFYFSETEVWHFLFSFALAFILGLSGVLIGRHNTAQIGKHEGTAVVTLTWVVFSFIGMMPYWLSGNIPNFTNAFFETISGFTTTGASILTDVEAMPKSILLWRSLTHWIGGLGIIVISLAILPIFGFTGSQLFSAEVTGISKEKIHPKISGTAKRLLLIYAGFTIAQSGLMYYCGMSIFDAVCNSLSTVSTGGFSTKNASISYWQSPAIEWIVIVFMTASGINFSLYYFLFRGKILKFFKDEEMRVYLAIMSVSTILVTFSLLNFSNLTWDSISETFRNSLFTVSSLMTTTGFYSVDYSDWVTVGFLLLLLTFIGGSASSTSGGLKVIRILLVFKYCYYEFKRILHPNAVFPVRYNGRGVKEQVITRMLAYVLLFIIISLLGSAILCLGGLGFEEAISAMVSSLGNVGPGLGRLGPIDNYSSITTFSKWFLSFAMLVGRLELFTVLLIFTPAFWKK